MVIKVLLSECYELGACYHQLLTVKIVFEIFV